MKPLINRLATALKGRTALFITHRQSLLRLATRIIILEAGQIIADGPRDAVLHRLALTQGDHDQ